MSNKELVIEAVRDLPDSAILAAIVEQVAILAAVCEGQEDVQAGRVVAHEEMKQRVASWIANYLTAAQPMLLLSPGRGGR